MDTGSSSWGLCGRGVALTYSSCCIGVKEKVELYTCSALGFRGYFYGKIYLYPYLYKHYLFKLLLSFYYEPE
jgi:hypothetical protein